MSEHSLIEAVMSENGNYDIQEFLEEYLESYPDKEK